MSQKIYSVYCLLLSFVSQAIDTKIVITAFQPWSYCRSSSGDGVHLLNGIRARKKLEFQPSYICTCRQEALKDTCLFLAKQVYNFFEFTSCVTFKRIAKQSVLFCWGLNNYVYQFGICNCLATKQQINGSFLLLNL